MPYDKEYARRYYLKNKKRINAYSRQWQAKNPDKHRKSWNNWRVNNKERDNENWRKRYHKFRDQLANKYNIMGRNTTNERVAKYLANPEYYKEKLKGKIKPEKLQIAYNYLDNEDQTLQTTGKEFHRGKERIRQIVYEVLWKIWKMKGDDMEEDNKKEPTVIEHMGKRVNPMTQEKFDKIKDMIYQGYTAMDIHEELHVAFSSIARIKKANTVKEYRELGNRWSKSYKKNHNKDKTEEVTKVAFRGDIPESPYPAKMLAPPFEGREKRDNLFYIQKDFWNAIQEYIDEEVERRFKEKLKKILET